MIGRVAAACALAALLAVLFAPRASARLADFEVYWQAGVRAAAAQPLYRAEDEHYQLKYLPAFAVLAIPAGWLPLATAKGVWFTASAVLIVLVIAMSLALLREHRKRPWALAALTFVAMAKFYGHELVLGQVNLLLTAVVLAAVHLLIRGRPAAAGMLVALAVVVKPYAMLLIPWLALRERRAAMAAAGGIAAALVLPAAIYGAGGTIALHRDWWRTVSGSTTPNLLNADNVSLAAMFAKWLGPGEAAAALAVLASAAVLAAAVAVLLAGTRVRHPLPLEAALLLTIMPLLSPQGWDYVFLVSTPAVMLLLNEEDRLRTPLRAATLLALATIAFSLYDLMGRDAYARFMALSLISVCYLVVVAALVAVRARRLA